MKTSWKQTRLLRRTVLFIKNVERAVWSKHSGVVDAGEAVKNARQVYDNFQSIENKNHCEKRP